MELTGEQLKKAETLLIRYLPLSLKVYGYLVLRNRCDHGGSDPVSVLVDTWPDFRIIICKPLLQQKDDVFKAILFFAKDEDILKKTLRNSSVIDWSRFLCFGINCRHMAILTAAASERGVSGSELAVCRSMMLEDVSDLPSIDSSGISLGSLDESHVSLVNRTWKFGQSEVSVRMIRNMITNFPSCCVLDAEARPVSWVLLYDYGAMGMLYTVPEHRGKGYATALVSSMAKWLQAEGCPVYCFIEEENRVSYELFRKLGFTEADPSYREYWLTFNDL